MNGANRYDPSRTFEYENAFYATAPINRISKFATHLELYRRITNLPGAVIECGVFKGNSLFRFIKFRALFENAFSRPIFAFDTFGSFPDAGFAEDYEIRARFIAEAGDSSISQEELTGLLEGLHLHQNVQLIKGDILETVPVFLAQRPELRIALLHIDVDLYEPTRAALEAFYPRLVRGGIAILDDYGAFPGANKAIEDFFADRPERVQKLPYSHAISYVEKSI